MRLDHLLSRETRGLEDNPVPEVDPQETEGRKRRNEEFLNKRRESGSGDEVEAKRNEPQRID